MKQIRIIRIFIAVLFFAASTAYVAIGPQVHPMAVVSVKSQVILSSISFSIGATVVWLLLTSLFGRVYCSTVCPVGTISDLFLRLRRRLRRFDKPFSYRKRRWWSTYVLIVYAVCLLLGLTMVPLAVEPWNIFLNIISVARPEAVSGTWVALGAGAVTGIACGVVSLTAIGIVSLLHGRRFCTDFCPVGYMMGLIDDKSLFHIAIDGDKCVSCGKCEDICRSECIKVSERLVDNSRCVRCFDCLAVCPHDAIRFRADRIRPATPMVIKN